MWASGRVVLWVDERWVIDEKLFNIHIPQSHEKKQIYNIVHAMSWGKVGMFSTPTFFSHVSRLSFTYLINFYFTRGAFTFFLEWKSPTRKFLFSSTQEKKSFLLSPTANSRSRRRRSFAVIFIFYYPCLRKPLIFIISVARQRRENSLWNFFSSWK